MSTMELLEQVRALPLEEKRSFFAAVHEVEKEVMAEVPAERHVINPPDLEAYWKKLDAIGSLDWDKEQLDNFDRWLAGEDVEDPPDRYVNDAIGCEKMTRNMIAKARSQISAERASKQSGESTAQ